MRRFHSSTAPVCILSASKLLTLLPAILISLLLVANALGQGTGKKMASEENERDQQQKRAEWNMRGREAPKGQSAAALRLKAHQQKMAMRTRGMAAARIAAARSTAPAGAAQTTPWVNLGPAPLASDATGNGGQDYNWVSGRATSVVIDASDSTGNTVLLGGAYGGLWKSTNAGSASANPDSVVWQSLIDDQSSLAVGAIALQPGNSNVILVGTGETNASGDSYYGMGILRSTDGGATWTQITAAASGQSFLGVGFSKMAFSTSNTNLVVASTAGDIGFDYGLEQDAVSTARGLYYSTDAGATWNRVTLSDGAVAASVTGVVYNPSQGANGTFYAAIRRHGIYSSTNGQTFTRLATQPTAGLASANCPANSNSTSCDLYRAEFAVTPGRKEMYVWVVDDQSVGEVDDGIWQSTNGGTAWVQIPDNGITNCGSGGGGTTQNPEGGCGVQQAFYNLELAALPNGTGTDVYAGTINLYKCNLASGASSCSTIDANVPTDWTNLTHVYGCSIDASLAHVHPDQHGLALQVSNAKAVGYFAHDGGISRTLDGFTGLNSGSCTGTNQFDSLSQTLGSMTEFVSFSVHPTSPDILLGGTQDNGSPKTATGTSSTSWQNALGGDGGYNVINPNPGPAGFGDGVAGDEWFDSNPDSEIIVCEDGTACNDTDAFIEAIPGYPSNGNIDQGAFYTPFILDPQNTDEMLIGTCRIWRGNTGTSIFAQLSVNFDTLDTTLCDGGEVNQVAGLAAGGPQDKNGFSNVIYATTWGYGPLANIGGGEVWVTTNAAATTPAMTNVTGSINPSNYAIAAVAIDTSVASGQTAYVGIMGFHTSHVWKTTNAGGAWTDWTGSGGTALPDAPVSALLIDSSVGVIYAGTDVGVFSSSTTGTTGVWTEVGPLAGSGSGFLPSAPVTAIRMFNSGNTKRLRVSTYGRGVWEYDFSTDFSVPTDLSDTGGANPGQTTTTTMTITPVGASTFGDNVTFTCFAGLPAGATCSFNPAQINAASSATTVTLTVQTAGPFTGAAGSVHPTNTRAQKNQSSGTPKLRSQNSRPWLPPTLPLAGVVFVGLAGRKLPRRYKIVGLCLAVVFTGFLVACGGGSSSSPPPPVVVSVSPGAVNSLYPSLSGAPAQTQQFTATVTNSTNAAVTWSVTGGSGNGTISATGLYTAPATLPSPAAVSVVATSQADATKSGSATVNLLTPTPAGTFPITVTVTEGTLMHTTTFNLVVN